MTTWTTQDKSGTTETGERLLLDGVTTDKLLLDTGTDKLLLNNSVEQVLTTTWTNQSKS
jgi:hypothetical protein